tara:strand:- start:243 stop:443 length:201 start_codon:yes stop_codon:yes gene_type:complete
MKYNITLELTGHIDTEIEAESVEEALETAYNTIDVHELPYADVMSAIEETQVILVHDEDGEKVWNY